jgi:hypothetical protein
MGFLYLTSGDHTFEHGWKRRRMPEKIVNAVIVPRLVARVHLRAKSHATLDAGTKPCCTEVAFFMNLAIVDETLEGTGLKYIAKLSRLLFAALLSVSALGLSVRAQQTRPLFLPLALGRPSPVFAPAAIMVQSTYWRNPARHVVGSFSNIGTSPLQHVVIGFSENFTATTVFEHSLPGEESLFLFEAAIFPSLSEITGLRVISLTESDSVDRVPLRVEVSPAVVNGLSVSQTAVIHNDASIPVLRIDAVVWCAFANESPTYGELTRQTLSQTILPGQSISVRLNTRCSEWEQGFDHIVQARAQGITR